MLLGTGRPHMEKNYLIFSWSSSTVYPIAYWQRKKKEWTKRAFWNSDTLFGYKGFSLAQSKGKLAPYSLLLEQAFIYPQRAFCTAEILERKHPALVALGVACKN